MLRFLALFALVLFAAGAAAAAVRTGHAETTLRVETTGLAPGGATSLLLDQTLDDGWHVYWKNPGDSGLPLDLQWTLPEGFAVSDVVYPTPARIPIGPLANYGFFGRPGFLVTLTAPPTARVGDSVAIGLKATWLICEEICVPEEASFALTLPVVAKAAMDSAVAARFADVRAAAPVPLGAVGSYRVDGAKVLFSIPAPNATGVDSYFFPETESLIEPAAPQRVATVEDGVVITATAAGGAPAPERIRGVFVPEGATRGFEVELALDPSLKVEASAAPQPENGARTGGPGLGLLATVAVAFFGGVILNIMPCVFPVIFIKAATLMKTGGANRADVRGAGLAYTAGVLAAFAALGGALLLLRTGGEAVGWGFHLQSPIVVLLSAYVLFLVGLNLAGVFHVGASLQNAGASLAAKEGLAGSFFTGLLAVVVAAPCVGPFLTAPIGAAVVLPPAAGLLVFLAMGAGLAVPFLLLSVFPGLGARLPRPGPWMETFRQALSFPVFAGAAYFLWVLTVQTGTGGLARALAGAVLLAAAAWAFERAKARGGARLALAATAAAAMIAALFQGAALHPQPAHDASASFAHGAMRADAWSEARLAALRAQGRPVFVDFTAAWCVNCQINKLTVLSDQRLAAAFRSRDVAVLVADWTSRDAAITRALAAFGANGVPLYAYYPPKGAPLVAPQPLSVAGIQSLLSKGD